MTPRRRRAGVVFGAGLAAAAALAVGCRAPEKVSVAPTRSAPAEGQPTDDVVAVLDGRLRLARPAGWVAGPDPVGGPVLLPLDSRRDRRRLFVSETRVPGLEDPRRQAELREAMSDEIERRWVPRGYDPVDYEEREVESGRLIVVESRLQGFDEAIWQKQFVFPRGDRLIVITGTAPATDMVEAEAVFDRVAESARFAEGEKP